MDAPEGEPKKYAERISDQAAYFGITPAQCVEVAQQAADFTRKALQRPFTVCTRWRAALGRSTLGRVYCIILTADGDDLNELLVSAGLVRIYGTKTFLPDGRNSSTYVAHLKELETKAKAEKRGGWSMVANPNP